MSKVVSAVFGIGIAVVVYVCMLLGIQAFYPHPEYNDFCEENSRIAVPYMGFESCADDITVGECRKQTKESSMEKDNMNQCQDDWNAATKNYSRNFFIIASILGVIALIVSYFLLNISSVAITNISAGVACSGIVMILWGFVRGWESTDEKLKFIIGLIIAVIVIALTVKLNKREGKK